MKSTTIFTKDGNKFVIENLTKIIARNSGTTKFEYTDENFEMFSSQYDRTFSFISENEIIIIESPDIKYVIFNNAEPTPISF
ncbi:hypothetical protein ACJQWY_01160 [Weissella kandleri]|uniref:hypothetical protein n=1 Tax=Weissella kandleri TaxID=1616 RepID=UPI00387EE835